MQRQNFVTRQRRSALSAAEFSSGSTNLSAVEYQTDKGRARPRGEPAVSRAEHTYQFEKISGSLSRSDLKDEKAVRQQDGLLFQGRIVPTEFEKDHQNFLAKSYWPEKGSVKGFLDNKCFCFQLLSNLINMVLQMTKNVILDGCGNSK
jgi:hypothetical protein